MAQPTQAVSERKLAVRWRDRRQGSWVARRQAAFPLLQALPLSSVLPLKTELTAPTGPTGHIAVPINVMPPFSFQRDAQKKRLVFSILYNTALACLYNTFAKSHLQQGGQISGIASITGWSQNRQYCQGK